MHSTITLDFSLFKTEKINTLEKLTYQNLKLPEEVLQSVAEIIIFDTELGIHKKLKSRSTRTGIFKTEPTFL